MKKKLDLPKEFIDFILKDTQEIITLDFKDLDLDDDDFFPEEKAIFDAKTLATDYISGIRTIMNRFYETRDIRYYDLACDLMPTAMFLHYKRILDARKAEKKETPTEIIADKIDEENK